MNSYRFYLQILCVAAAVWAVGCGAGPIYSDNDSAGGFGAMSVTPRRQWSAVGNLNAPQSAIDGQSDTIARAPHNAAGFEIVIDLGEPCVFQTVILDHGDAEMGFCGQVEFSSSADGRSYAPQYRTVGTRRVTILLLPEPVLTQFVRLRCTRTGPQPWALAEIYFQ
jgi:hypothetical protein